MSDIVTVRVAFLSAPGEPPAHEWEFSRQLEPTAQPVDEYAFESDLRGAFVEAGGAETLSFSRTSSWGGWGTDGPVMLTFSINVAASLLSTELWGTVQDIYRKRTGVDPLTSSEGRLKRAPSAEDPDRAPNSGGKKKARKDEKKKKGEKQANEGEQQKKEERKKKKRKKKNEKKQKKERERDEKQTKKRKRGETPDA